MGREIPIAEYRRVHGDRVRLMRCWRRTVNLEEIVDERGHSNRDWASRLRWAPLAAQEKLWEADEPTCLFDELSGLY